jgi:hypothetical protein
MVTWSWGGEAAAPRQASKEMVEIDRSVASIHVQGRGIQRAPKAQKHMKTGREFRKGAAVMVSDGRSASIASW